MLFTVNCNLILGYTIKEKEIIILSPWLLSDKVSHLEKDKLLGIALQYINMLRLASFSMCGPLFSYRTSDYGGQNAEIGFFYLGS